MEDNRNSSKSVGVCEKILRAVTVFPVHKKIRRISSRQQVPGPASSAPNPSLPIHTPGRKTIDIQTKPPGPEHPNSLKGSQRLEAIEVPIEFDYSSLHSPNVEGKPATPHLPIQNNSPGPKVASVKQDNNKPDLISLQEKPNLKRQDNGQGVKATSEVVEKHKPKLEAPAKRLIGEGQHHVVIAETRVQNEGKQPGLDINDTFSDYIKRVKMKIRTLSNVGGGKNATGPDDAQDTKKGESAKDHFSEYINRAKMKIRRLRTTPSIGSGR